MLLTRRTDVFLSVPRFSPHQAKASAQLCLSLKAVSIFSSSANNLISTSGCRSQLMPLGCKYTYLDTLRLGQGLCRLGLSRPEEMINNVAVERLSFSG